MLTDIFSAFDPAINTWTNYYISAPLFWASNFIMIIMLTTTFWLIPTRVTAMSSMTSSTLFYQASRTSGTHLKSFTSILSSLFIILVITNMYGLIPYSFSISSHLIFTLTLGLTLWLSLIMSSVFFSGPKFIAALLPSGAPDWLNPFLVLIETISISVRPVTLSFRLAANMSAGHIVLGLMGIYTASAMFSSTYTALLLLTIQFSYVLFEVGICLVQAYIFTLLLTLYADDHPL
uniref:ATP synthase subunit a n=1 Tax=Polychaeta sp. TaxID=3061522 RepID=A0AAU8L1B2_9ANNE